MADVSETPDIDAAVNARMEAQALLMEARNRLLDPRFTEKADEAIRQLGDENRVDESLRGEYLEVIRRRAA